MPTATKKAAPEPADTSAEIATATKPLMRRPELAQFLQGEGFPITESRIAKAAMVGCGPPVAGWFGRTPLYEPHRGLEWARSLLTETPSRLEPGR